MATKKTTSITKGIEDLRFRPLNKELNGSTLIVGFVSLTWHGLTIPSMRLMDTDGRYWLAMPSQKSGDKWQDACYFKSADVRDAIINAILKAKDEAEKAVKTQKASTAYSEPLQGRDEEQEAA